MEGLVDRPARLRLSVASAATKPTFTDIVSIRPSWFAAPLGASPPARSSRRSTARARSSRSGSATACYRRTRQPASSRSSRSSPSTAISRSPTFRIPIGGETIVATGIHRFWKAGKGWTMARDLKPGDRLRIVGGATEVRSIETDATQPVYNLDVAENRDFFVGNKGLLVHDFSFVQPVWEPFDRPDEPSAEAVHNAGISRATP